MTLALYRHPQSHAASMAKNFCVSRPTRQNLPSCHFILKYWTRWIDVLRNCHVLSLCTNIPLKNEFYFHLCNWLNLFGLWKLTAFGSPWWKSSKYTHTHTHTCHLHLSLSVFITLTLFPQGLLKTSRPHLLFIQETGSRTQLVRFHRGLL